MMLWFHLDTVSCEDVARPFQLPETVFLGWEDGSVFKA